VWQVLGSHIRGEASVFAPFVPPAHRNSEAQRFYLLVCVVVKGNCFPVPSQKNDHRAASLGKTLVQLVSHFVFYRHQTSPTLVHTAFTVTLFHKSNICSIVPAKRFSPVHNLTLNSLFSIIIRFIFAAFVFSLCPSTQDTEFPGIVARPVGSFKTTSEKNYQTLRCNVNLLKIIQLGLTFCDKDGNVPENGRCIWQFNFKFDLQYDMFAQDSIQLLTDSGINFKRHATEGIDVQFFAEKIMCSGIVLSDDVKWISFHSAYDFGYLIKLLTSLDLPETESEFFRLLKLYFPHIYDVKYLMKNCETLRGGLNQLGQDLNVSRFGPAHQAGSDSLLTLHTFFAIVEQYFDSNLDEKHIGVLFGLNANGDTNGVMNYNSYTNSSTPLHFYSPSPSLSGTPKR